MFAAWPAALLSEGAMGFAIQRGGTCTVCAVDEVLTQGRAQRLLAQPAGLAGSMPAAPGAGLWAACGGALLGLGAWVNGACDFGAVGRLGSGEWACAAAPLGFCVGCLSVMPLFPWPAAITVVQPSPRFQSPGLFARAFFVFARFRLAPGPCCAALRLLWPGAGAAC
jgi:toxin CptA